jgi:hypothetical protein
MCGDFMLAIGRMPHSSSWMDHCSTERCPVASLPKNEVGALFGTKSATVRRSTNSRLSSELRSWIDNCIVPILVKEYFAVLESEKNIDLSPETVTNCVGEVNSSTEVRK